MKRVDIRSRARLQGDVHQAGRGPLFRQPQPRPIVAISGDLHAIGVFGRHIDEAADTKGGQRRIVEGGGPRELHRHQRGGLHLRVGLPGKEHRVRDRCTRGAEPRGRKGAH